MGEGSIALAFHERTKHRVETIATSGRTLDWDNKPYPFKTYDDDLTVVPLPSRLERVLMVGAGVLRKRDYGGETIYFRTYASAGALYPVETYVVDASGVYHFDPLAKKLLRLRDGDKGAGTATHLVMTGIPWRTSWKYGDRGYRHLFWDAGTILANVLALAGADAKLRLGFDDRKLADLVDVDGEREFPLCVLSLGEGELSAHTVAPLGLRTRPLSVREERFPAIERVHAAGVLGGGDIASWRAATPSVAREVPLADDVERVIRRRGSARRFGGRPVPLDVMREILAYGTHAVECDAGSLSVRVFAAVHNVTGLEPGTYEWDGGELRRLMRRDVRADAAYLCLGQRLGGSGAATLFLMADLATLLDRFGDRGYRVAQLAGGLTLGRLDLAAHATGYGSTGLTFFDDDVTGFFSPSAAGLSCMVVCAIGQRSGKRLPLA
jgi:SagB-type dehydrogenase family enzyme